LAEFPSPQTPTPRDSPDAADPPAADQTATPATLPSNPYANAPPATALPAVLASPARDARALWLEVAVVLTLAVIPYLFSQLILFALPAGQLAYPSFELLTLTVVLRCLQVVVPVLYLMHRSREPWATFGLHRLRWIRDPLSGVFLFVVGYVLYVLGFFMLTAAHDALFEGPFAAGVDREWSAHLPVPHGWSGGLCIVALSICNGFAEELVMRGYLIPRLQRLLGRASWAVLATTALFAACHVYQGAPGLLTTTILGLLYGVVFCHTRRLWPVAIAHMLADLSPFASLIQ
jgi:membrane protease YdiL (CAAX protease family)